MSKFLKKLRLFFVPFLICLAAMVLGYSSLHWLLFIQAEIIPVDEEILNFWGPAVIAGLLAIFCIWPRINKFIIKPKGSSKDSRDLIAVIAWLALTAPTVITQLYMVSAGGKLTPLVNITDINQKSLTRYYTAKHFFIDKSLAKAAPQFEVTGRYNDKFEMNIYIASPMFGMDNFKSDSGKLKTAIINGDADRMLIVKDGRLLSRDSLSKLDLKDVFSVDIIKGTAAISIYGDRGENGVLLITTKEGQAVRNPNLNIEPSAWLAVRYQKVVSSRLSAAEKESAYKDFAKESSEKFTRANLNDFTYLKRVGPGKDRRGYTDAITGDNKLNAGKRVVLLEPQHDTFSERSGNEFPWIFGSSGIGFVAFLLILLCFRLKTDTLITKEEQKAARLKAKYGSRSLFKGRMGLFSIHPGYTATPVIVMLNIAVFIIMVFAGLGFISFQTTDVLKWGGNFRPDVFDGQYWRLLTSMFLHGGVMHLAFNMYGLLFVGIFLEPVLGSNRYLLVYILTGLLASIASIIWHPATVSVGASGAIFGLYGVFLALLTTNLFPPEIKKPFLINTALFVGYNLLMGLAGNTDNAAHIGGLLSGLVLGYIFYPTLKNRADQLAAEKETEQLLDDLSGGDNQE